jgi:hypothetical protein
MKFWGWQMVRKLTVTLAIALLMFVIAPIASADLITTPTGILVIPDGSQVTSVFLATPVSFGVDFQFQGGTGSTSGNFLDGYGESITFTVPVTNLSFTAIILTFEGNIFADGVPVFVCSDFPPLPPTNPCPSQPFDLTLSGPIDRLGLDTTFATNYAGIESLSFTVDAGDPPTSSLIFLGVGLIGLVVSSRRKVPVCH